MRRTLSSLVMLLFGVSEPLAMPGRSSLFSTMTQEEEKSVVLRDPEEERCWSLFSEGLGTDLPRSVATTLKQRGITMPTAIQTAAMAPLRAGESALVCAETGSGKSVAFLLPSFLRLLNDPNPVASVLVLAPTRELAVQLATEASALSTAVFGDDLVELVAPGTATTVGGLRNAKCIVATPKEFLTAFQGRPPLLAKLGGVATCVLDEIDALLPPKEKKDYRTEKSKARARKRVESTTTTMTNSERKKRHLAAEATARKYPTAAVLDFLLKTNGRRDLQLIGASATASRTTRDALDKLATGEDPYGRFENLEKQIPVLRPVSDRNGETAPRAVVVPSVVDHRTYDLEKKAALSLGAKAIAEVLNIHKPKSALVFLTEASGYTVVKTTKALDDLLDPNTFTVAALHDRLFGWNSMSNATTTTTPAQGPVSKKKLEALAKLEAVSSKRPPPRRTADLEATRMMLAQEFSSREEKSPVLVTFEATARGLHFDAVDLVIVVGLPKTSGSYLHLAGRTGRRLNDDTVPGTVVTLCAPKAQAVLRSWSKQLGDITFEPL